MLYIRQQNSSSEPSTLQTATWRFQTTALYRFPFPSSFVYFTAYKINILWVTLYMDYMIFVFLSVTMCIQYISINSAPAKYYPSIASACKAPNAHSSVMSCACMRLQYTSYHRNPAMKSQIRSTRLKFGVCIQIYVCIVLSVTYNCMEIGGLDTICGLYHTQNRDLGDCIFSPSSLGGCGGLCYLQRAGHRAYSTPFTAINPFPNPIGIYVKYGHTRWNYILLFLAFRFEVYVFHYVQF